MFLGLQIESYEHSLFIGEVSHDAPGRRRKFLDQGGYSDDLLVSRQERLLKDVDHQQLVAVFQMRFANAAQIFH